MSDVYILQVCTICIKISVLYYVDDCVYWYTYEALVNGFVGTLGKDISCKLLGMFTLVHVNKNFLDEVSFRFCESG